jgi:hypothetical protein
MDPTLTGLWDDDGRYIAGYTAFPRAAVVGSASQSEQRVCYKGTFWRRVSVKTKSCFQKGNKGKSVTIPASQAITSLNKTQLPSPTIL